MRRPLLIAAAAAMLAMSVPAAAGAAVKEGQASIVATVSFRTAPSTSSIVVRYLKAGEKVALLEKVNDYWWKVRESGGNTGYISSSSSYMKLVSAPVDEPDTSGNAVVVSTVSFRQAPSTSGAFIRYLKKDEVFTVTAKVNGYWYAATDAGGQQGYVSSSETYVKLTGAIPGSTGGAGTSGGDSAPGGSASSGSGASAGGGSSSAEAEAAAKVEAVIAAGLKYLGTPYEYGSDRNTTTTFDCSDFVRTAFKDALGVKLPSDSASIGAYVRQKTTVTTDWTQLKRGDLMFFMDYKGTSASLYKDKAPLTTKVSHMGIYLGNGQILHTYSVDSGGVRIDNIQGKHWEYRFLYGGSAL